MYAQAFQVLPPPASKGWVIPEVEKGLPRLPEREKRATDPKAAWRASAAPETATALDIA